MSDSLLEQPPKVEIKDQQDASVENRLHQAHLSFDSWLDRRVTEEPLVMSKNVVEAFLPRRLFELSDNPEQIEIIMVDNEETETLMLKFFVVEHGNSGLTDKAEWDKAMGQIEQERKASIDEHGVYIQPKKPSNVDALHWRYKELVKQGLIKLEDKILLSVNLSQDEADTSQLYVGEYEDREDLRGQGLASAFYDNLSDLARRMGYRFITGSNNAENVDFFVNKLGRVPLGKIKPAHWSKFRKSGHNGDERKFFTIQFLYSEDKEEYLTTEASNQE